MQPGTAVLDPVTRGFYERILAALDGSGLPFLVGGAYALAHHTGIARHTKDLDIFVRRADRDGILAALEEAGFVTEIPFPHWLAKAHGGDGAFADVIYDSGNGVAVVDDDWFAHSVTSRVLDIPVRVCPAEEMIWQKAYILERERCDVADVAHLIRARGASLDWDRLLRRFGPHWRVLLSHLVLFGFTYPAEREAVPAQVLRDLTGRLSAETDRPISDGRICCGTFLSREQYLIDIGSWGYADARLRPPGRMSPADVALWTAAIESK